VGYPSILFWDLRFFNFRIRYIDEKKTSFNSLLRSSLKLHETPLKQRISNRLPSILFWDPLYCKGNECGVIEVNLQFSFEILPQIPADGLAITDNGPSILFWDPRCDIRIFQYRRQYCPSILFWDPPIIVVSE